MMADPKFEFFDAIVTNDGAFDDLSHLERSETSKLSSPVKIKKRRLQKKAPNAPKRGKSPYILFSMDKREEIKAQLPPSTGKSN